ncbi:hypothetical protein BH23BAC2_BH23BAC2_16790 [soil metagenome]
MGLLKEFKEFAVKGNMIDMAVGIIIGTAFNKVVDVLVKQVVLPPLSLMTDGLNFANQKIVLREEVWGEPGANPTVEEVSIGYGVLSEALIDFLVVGFTIFLVVKFINRFRRKAQDPDNKTVETPKDIQLLSDLKNLMAEQNELLKKQYNKMRKSIIYSAAFILFISFSTFSQEIKMGNYEMYINYKKGEYIGTKTSKIIVGTPYLNENFQVGILSFEGKDPITAGVRYNVLKEEIEVNLEGEIYTVQEDVEVKINQVSYKKLFYKSENNEVTKGYFKEISGKINKQPLVLLEKPYKRFKEAQPVAAMKTPTPAEYIDKADFFLKFQNTGSAILVDNKINNFLQVFPSQSQDQIKDFMKVNKLKTKTKEDLIKIINFYNSNF